MHRLTAVKYYVDVLCAFASMVRALTIPLGSHDGVYIHKLQQAALLALVEALSSNDWALLARFEVLGLTHNIDTAGAADYFGISFDTTS
eukprot:11236962-Karenia_brevis.AAC.1